MAEEYEREITELRKLQKELSKIESSQQDYILKKHENEMVKTEFELIEDQETNVFKLIGPALIPQAISEAKGNVDTRLEFINKEITRLNKLREDFVKKAKEKQEKVLKIQRDLQARQ